MAKSGIHINTFLGPTVMSGCVSLLSLDTECLGLEGTLKIIQLLLSCCGDLPSTRCYCPGRPSSNLASNTSSFGANNMSGMTQHRSIWRGQHVHNYIWGFVQPYWTNRWEWWKDATGELTWHFKDTKSFFPSISLASSPPHKLRWGKFTLKFLFQIVQKLKMLVNNSMTNFSKWRRKSVKIWRDLRRQKWRVLKLHEHSVWIRVSSYDVQTTIPGKNSSHSTVGLFGFPSFCLQT